jgi:cell division septation protein DedD
MSDRSASLSKKESGEFEFVLGNSLLLSLFFLVVVLLGVSFAMGYIIGRNSNPIETASATSTPPPAAKQSAARESPPAIVPAAREESTPAGESKQPAKPSTAGGTSPQVVPVSQPEPGETYLQVLAVAKPEAEVLAEVLLKKGFRAIVAPGPNEEVYRVLVGPAKDTADVIKLKADLEHAGFRPFPKRY